MSRRVSTNQGFSAIEAIIIVVIIAVIGLGGWLVWQHNHTKKAATTTSNNAPQQKQQSSNTQTADLSEGGKYLVIKEWGVRVALPQDLQSKTAYTITDAVDPDTNLPLQAAKIYIASDSLSANDCAVISTGLGASTDSGAQYIRSDSTKPFNAARYKGTFKEGILSLGNYIFHLNYVTPECVGDANAVKIKDLQNALVQPVKVD